MMKKCTFLLAAVLAAQTLSAQCTHPDFAALMAFYNAAGGANWVYNGGWEAGAAGTDCNVCDWDYVTCNGQDRVTGVTMFSNNLIGTLAPEIGDLEFLEYFDIQYCSVGGPIPVELGNLSNLKWLKIGDNDFTGGIPKEIGNLANLEELHIGNLNDVGALPTELGNLTKLKKLFAPSSNVSGQIPASLGNLTSLTLIELSFNDLSGTIPSTLGNLINLSELDLGYNDLEGEIPATLGNLVNTGYVGLNSNNLSGCFPNSLKSLCGSFSDFSNNAGLPGGGNFAAFCADWTGSCDPVSGTNEKQEASISLYPNPVSEVLYFTQLDGQSFTNIDQLVIFDATGVEIMSEKNPTGWDGCVGFGNRILLVQDTAWRESLRYAICKNIK